MYLKSIEVHGFKSFANKLVFEFHNGITGIVGPNGSGKSNVADAVRWVLGEQSAKQLRGSNMQDIIFSGTEARKPQSYAYVALTITNEDHRLAVPYEEVQVARRVYRSGESEYLINGASCRLKDVQEMFFDTGIGKEGYSIIGQGQVDKILSGKPEERRELFDEAAGIVKFKKRKAKTEKDLEAERQNMIRVNDILMELEKQVGPLERQSEKAKEFLRLKEELKTLEINMFLVDYETFGEDVKEAQENHKNALEEQETAKEKQENVKAEYAEIESTVERFNQQIEKNKTKVNEDRLLLSKYENEINMANQTLESIAQGKEYYAERIHALEKTIEDTKKEKSEYLESQKKAFEELDVMREDEKSKEEALLATEHHIEDIKNQMSEKNQAVYSYMDQINDINVEQQKYDSMLEQNSIKKAELAQKILSNKSLVAGAVEDMEREEKALHGVVEQMDALRQNKNELLTKVQDDLAKERELEREVQEKQKQFHIEDTKLSSLKNIAERYDGYGQSIRRVMEQKKTEKGIVGVVADIIKVDPKYQVAIETALGGTIQNIVTEDEKTAKRLIEMLKKNRYGRATFLPLTTVNATQNNIKEEIFDEPGVIGKASSVVHKEDRFDELVEYILGRYVLVDDVDHALALARKYHHSLRIVTLEGELLNPGGSISGGAFKNSSHLLGRATEIEQLEKKLAGL